MPGSPHGVCCDSPQEGGVSSLPLGGGQRSWLSTRSPLTPPQSTQRGGLYLPGGVGSPAPHWSPPDIGSAGEALVTAQRW